MKEILIAKLDSWTAETVSSRYNISNPLNGYLWETTPDGIFLYRNDNISAVHLFTNDGKVHKVSNRFTTIDFECHQKLYALSQNTNDFRLEIPISAENFTHNYILYSYTVVERPNKEHGDKIFAKMFDNSLTTADLLTFVDDVTVLLGHLKSLDCPLPNAGLDITLQCKDTVGSFWSDFKIWDSSYQFFVNKTIELFKANVGLMHKQVDTLDVTTIIQTAETKWKAI